MTTSEETNVIPQPGSVIRYAAWNGVVLDVFKSETSDKHILQIMFAKNIYNNLLNFMYEDLRVACCSPIVKQLRQS
jgi:hypothetical protein